MAIGLIQTMDYPTRETPGFEQATTTEDIWMRYRAAASARYTDLGDTDKAAAVEAEALAQSTIDAGWLAAYNKYFVGGPVNNPNLLSNPNDFSGTGWGRIRIVETSDTESDPEGGNTAQKYVSQSGETALKFLRWQAFDFVAGQDYCFSIYAASDSNNTVARWCQIFMRATAFPAITSAWFDIHNGAAGTAQNVADSGIIDTGVEYVPGFNWYRIWMSATADATVTDRFDFNLGTANNGSSFTGDGVSGPCWYYAKLENTLTGPTGP